MADINIERKKSSIWPWLLGLVLLAAVAFAAWVYLGDRDADLADDDVELQTEPYREPAPPPPASTEPAPGTTEPAPGSTPDTAPATTTGL